MKIESIKKGRKKIVELIDTGWDRGLIQLIKIENKVCLYIDCIN